MAYEERAIQPGKGYYFFPSAWRRVLAHRNRRSAGGARATRPTKPPDIPLPEDVEPMRVLLSRYSGIPFEDTEAHIYHMRDVLWDVYPNACISKFRFASLSFRKDTYFRVALNRLMNAPKRPGVGEMRLLDLGCCVGQVLRTLAYEGIDSSWLYGVDIEPRFEDLGYSMFRDLGKFKATFVVGDLLAEGDSDKRLVVLDRKMTFIHASSFFHLFPWDYQVRIATRVIRFLDPKAQDVMIFGRQVGNMQPSIVQSGIKYVYLHNAETWQKLWDEVGQRTGTKWKATTLMTGIIESLGPESALRESSFCVTRAG